MFVRMAQKSGQIFLPFCQGSRVWQTDEQTDGRTEFWSLYRVSITCSAVKSKQEALLPQRQRASAVITLFRVTEGHWLLYQLKVRMNNTNLHPIPAPFSSYCRLLVKFALSTGSISWWTLTPYTTHLCSYDLDL